jgi:outer membrane protein assembly factor BamB
MLRRATVALLFVTLFAGADWPRFRGPDGAGLSDDKGLPTTWSATDNIVWKTALPGFGSSSPITLGDRIYLTAYSGYAQGREAMGSQNQLGLSVLCIDRSNGKIVWQKEHNAELPETPYDGGRIGLHGYASSTCVTDGKAIYVFLGKTGVFKYSLDGEVVWNASVGAGVDKHKWGSGASPILHAGLLIVNASAESQSIRALKTSNGQEVWRVDGIADSWSTPLVVKTAAGGDELVVVERFRVIGIDPTTGKELWFYKKDSDYICPSVIAQDGVAYLINSRFKALLMAVKTGGRGDIGNSHVLWKKQWTTRVSTPVLQGGHLYGIDQMGIAYCFDIKTGEEVAKKRLDIDGGGDKIYASLVAADGKFYGVTREDGTVVLSLTPDLKVLAHNRLGDESIFNATPAISNSELLLRSDKFLYCIGK